MPPPIISYPLDLTGRSADNLVVGEPHTVAASGNRAFVPNSGPFFTRWLVVRAQGSGTPLTPGVHYKAVQLFPEATERTGEEICSVIVILEGTPGTQFNIDYQVLGGDYSGSVEAIEAMIAALDLDNRAIVWGAIIGKPDYFPPAPHIHDIGSTYGWEFVVTKLEAIRQAILQGDAVSHDEIYQYIDIRDQFVLDGIADFDARLQAHVQNVSNPHNTTKDQIGLSLVQNFAVASQVEAAGGEVNDKYMTPLRVSQAINALVRTSFSAHLADTANPHATTKTQVGLGNVENYALATQLEAEAGISNVRYMTPLRVAQAIAALASGGDGGAHAARTDNPHGTTKTHVGLSLVQNYAVASQAEAQAGTANDKYMTPLRVAQAIAVLGGGGGGIDTIHRADVANPHATTKAQVGLGSVENYAVATQAQAQAGTATNLYMTPQRTAQAIAALTTAPTWGGIVGTLGSQADLVAAFALKANLSGATFTGAVSAPSFDGPSDVRLKDNIKPFNIVDQEALSKIELWSWTWNSLAGPELEGKESSGVIADDVEKVFPNCVTVGEDGIKRVDYGKLAVHLILSRG